MHSRNKEATIPGACIRVVAQNESLTLHSLSQSSKSPLPGPFMQHHTVDLRVLHCKISVVQFHRLKSLSGTNWVTNPRILEVLRTS